MVKRPTPAYQALMEALAAHASYPLVDGRAMPLDTAIETVKRRFRCQRNTAQDWLAAWATDPSSGVILVSLTSESVWRDGNWNAKLSDYGWRSIQYTTSFDNRGVPTIGRTGTRLGSHLVYVSSLPGWQEKVDREIAELREAEQEAERTKVATFRELHGESLDVISAWVEQIPRPEFLDLGSVLRISNHDSSQFHGTAGSLTIDVQGTQIEALAEMIRQYQESSRIVENARVLLAQERLDGIAGYFDREDVRKAALDAYSEVFEDSGRTNRDHARALDAATRASLGKLMPFTMTTDQGNAQAASEVDCGE